MASQKFLLIALLAMICLLAMGPATPARASENVVIVVQTTLYAWGVIDDALDRFMDDLTREGYSPQIYVCAESETFGCEELRAYLKSVYDTDGLTAVILLEAADMGAQIPRAFFEEFSPGDSGPIDFYYSDLDGFWDDTDSNGFFDVWENGPDGDMAPEIWVGRMSTIMTAGDRLNPYFDRNHAWRTGTMTFEERSLHWVSSNWMSAYDRLNIAYDDIGFFHGTEEDPLTDDEYFAEIQNSYEHHFVASHASASANAWITSVEIPWQNPHIGFYQEWGCRAGNYNTTMTCLMAEYVFGTTYGLWGIAWANSGGLYPSVLE